MGRVAKKAIETPKKAVEDLATVTQTRARRTPKPNPKYANESVVITPKIESSESNGSTDIEDKLPESKIVKSTKKVISKNPEEAKKSTPAAKRRASAVAAAVKKQKIDFDDDEKTKDADEIPISPTPPPVVVRATRSGKADVKDEKGEIKVGDESVAIIDVSSIIAKGPTKQQQQQDSPKAAQAATTAAAAPARSVTRKRTAAEVVEAKEDSPKKKKEEEKPSLITARKSYMPASKRDDKSAVNEVNEAEIKKEAVLTPVSTIKTRRNANTPQAAATAATAEEKKPKLEEVTVEPKTAIASPTTTTTTTIVKQTVVEPKKLPVMKKEAITKVAPVSASQTLPTKPRVINNVVLSPQKSPATTLPAPRVLNSMVTPKGARLSPNVKLASSDGTDKKVFSIEMSDGSLIEKKQVMSPIKTTSSAIKENVAIAPKPQPSMLLKNKLESELNRMKASANLMKRQMITPQIRHSQAAQAQAGARRVTKFESWYVIDVKGQDYTAPIKHTHSHSLTRIGNKIKDIQMPSTKWDYKVTLQKKQLKKQNNNDEEDADEVYTGEVDKTLEAERHNFEPTSILFKRSYRDNNKNIIDRSLMLKQNAYAITMNGKQCQLVGAPDDISSIEDLEILLNIIDSCSVNHPCVESS